MCFLAPVWRSIKDLPLTSEVFRVSNSHSAATAHSLSHSTLEVACNPGITNIAITERKQPDVWRWAIVSAGDALMEEGCAATQEDARRTAVGALERVTERMHLEGSVRPR